MSLYLSGGQKIDPRKIAPWTIDPKILLSGRLPPGKSLWKVVPQKIDPPKIVTQKITPQQIRA